MKIPKDVILIWTGDEATIPSDWLRENSLNGLYPKGWGNQLPNQIGGSATHSHTVSDPGHSLQNHTHTYTLNAYCPDTTYPNKGWTANEPNFNIPDCHTHTGTTGNANNGGLSSVNFTSGNASNEPPFKDVIFIKAGLASLLRDNICALWDKNTLPSGWSDMMDYHGKFLKGSNTSSSGNTGGSLTHSHSINHTHTIIPHNHASSWCNDWPGVSGGWGYGRTPVNNWTTYVHAHWCDYGNDNTANSTTSYTGTYNTTEQVEPEYVKLGLIKKTSSGKLEIGIIGLWLGSENSIPKGWVLCDGNNGTLNLKNKFIKISPLNEVGQTGGSNTHSHAGYSHGHSAISHTHPITTGYANNNTYEPAWSGYYATKKNHTHTGTTNAVNMTFNNSTLTFASADNQPPYRTVAFIQLQKRLAGAGMMMGLLN
jgi:hypothetical protein